MKKSFFIILIVLLPLALYSQENSSEHRPEELFFKGNEFYNNEKYEDALNTYLEITSEYASGNLYYNMGNACFRLNMIGHAILYYERARLLMPRDPDLNYNLNYVRKLTKDAVDIPTDIISSALFWTGSMTVDELFWLFAIINLFLWCALIARIYIKKEWTFYLPFILLAIWLVIGASWSWRFYSISVDDRAVVLSEEVDVLSGPDEREKLLFQLHSGTIVIQERMEDNWRLIRLDDRRGWVRNSDVEKIKIQQS